MQWRNGELWTMKDGVNELWGFSVDQITLFVRFLFPHLLFCC